MDKHKYYVLQVIMCISDQNLVYYLRFYASRRGKYNLIFRERLDLDEQFLHISSYRWQELSSDTTLNEIQNYQKGMFPRKQNLNVLEILYLMNRFCMWTISL